MTDPPSPPLDPDRFLNPDAPGAHEWWYFDAVSDDGRDAVALVWYAALPFDPAYGVAAIRHLDNPTRRPKPDPLDHCAIGLSIYRDGKPIAYALNGYRRPDFRHRPDPFRIEVAGNTLDRVEGTYRLHVETAASNRRDRLRADLTFRPAAATGPLERDFGTAENPHLWMLPAPDCRVEGSIAVSGKRPFERVFQGRGYHDHNAGADELSRSFRRWAWGRVHVGPSTHIYYRAEPHRGPSHQVWITCRDGRPEVVRDSARFVGDDPPFEDNGRGGNVFGVRHGKALRVEAGLESLTDNRTDCVDDGPFYRRWVSRFEVVANGSKNEAIGISEWLETRNLNRALFNWMIPFRLRKPRDSRMA